MANKDNKLFCDLETIPSATMPKIEDIKVPATYKNVDSIAKYQCDNQVEVYKKQALDSMQGRIICIGYAYNGIVSVISLEDEKETLELFYYRVKEIFDDIMETPHFVGWNVSGFDLIWLYRKSIQYNLPELRALIPKDNKNLYTDLMLKWAGGYKDFVSQSKVAKFLGIPHDDSFSGSDVYDAWQAGDIDKIKNHCDDDIRCCIKLYERMVG
jgi:predicted PolB exonuclease-like 3'-5' exonuclease